MIWQHMRAILWLRWRLMINHWRRAGSFNAVVMTVAAIAALTMAVPLGLISFGLGIYLFPKASPVGLLYLWDALVVGFLFFWVSGLVTELQRADPLTISKFLHLPVLLNGAFLINYVSSLLRLSLILFVPVMMGLCLALVFTKGALLILALPLLTAFLLMVTSLTYQFQGWLASLMSNPRRRRTVVFLATAFIILIAQLPQLVNIIRPWETSGRDEQAAALVAQMEALNQSLAAQEMNAEEFRRRQEEILAEHDRVTQQLDREQSEMWEGYSKLLNLVLPVGWLPLGVASVAEGRVLPAFFALVGMSVIGVGSLWRAYRTTIRLYRGSFDSKPRPQAAVKPSPRTKNRSGARLLERRLPGFSEPVSAIALAGLRSHLRAPEMKMMMLTPLLIGGVFGAMLISRGPAPAMPDPARPLLPIAGMGIILLGLLQIMTNQFGFDRDGFRVFVLSPVSRRDVLLGKNLSFVPFAVVLVAILLTVVQAALSMRLDHLLAMVPQFVSMYLLFCVLTNLTSIYAPHHVAAGSLKAARPSISKMLLQLAMIGVFFPLTQVWTLLPLGFEALLHSLGWVTSVPIYLLLSLVECAVIVFVYHVALNQQARLLQTREQRIVASIAAEAS